MTAPAWPWPDSLDALQAAPKHHRLVMENDRVRVLNTEIAPGDRTPVHTHCWPAVHYLISWGDFVRRDQDGLVLVDTRANGTGPAPGSAVWGEALGPHSLENVGMAPIHVVSIEVKD